MTNTHVTRSLIYLNLTDTDGLIDLARGVHPDDITTKQLDLMQRLSTAIIQPIVPASVIQNGLKPLMDFDDVQGSTNAVGAGMHRNGDDDPETMLPVDQLFEGRLALAVYPLETLGATSSTPAPTTSKLNPITQPEEANDPEFDSKPEKEKSNNPTTNSGDTLLFARDRLTL